MTADPDANADDADRPPDAGKLPTGRLARTARVGGLVTGQGLRWAGMRTANRMRSPERAAQAERERTAAAVRQLVDQLGQMRGAAMKVGQMLSMADFDGLPEDQQDELQRKLAELRDDIPPIPFAKLEKLLRQEFGGPLETVFSHFDERAFAAASIGQVHRATTVDGAEVAVKVQYPGVAEAVETDLRNAMLLLPLVKRLAPGLDAKGLATEMRERIGGELDYELEAANHRRIERLVRGHPFIRVPRVHTDLCTRRVLVTEYVEGERFEAVRREDEGVRDRYGEIVFRFFFGLLYRDRIALGDPHPGNYLLCGDGRVCFLDFGLLSDVPAARVDASARSRERYATATRGVEDRAGGGRLPPARGSGRRGRRRMGAADDADGDRLVRDPGRAALLAPGSPRARAARAAGPRAARRDARADQPVHAAAGRDADPPHARDRRRRPRPAPRGCRLGRDRRRVPARCAAATALGEAEAAL